MKHIFAFLLLTALILSACAPVSAPTSVPATGVALLSTNTPVPTATFTSTPAPTATATATPTATSTVTPQPTATPNLANFRVEMWSSTSPNGEWKALVVVALPVISDTAISRNYYTQLKVSKVDGTTEWIIVDEWSEWELGYTIPQPLYWSHDGRYLYITNKPVPDGCAVFVNGSDLHKVDLNNGSVEEIVPPVGLWLSLSPDETKLAYIGYRDRGLVIRDLATGTQRETKLNPGEEYQAGYIIWSPDGSTLILALALRPCSTDWADSTSIIRVDVASLEQTMLLQRSKQLFVPVEWATADKVLLKDKGGDYWLIDVTTGRITKK